MLEQWLQELQSYLLWAEKYEPDHVLAVAQIKFETIEHATVRHLNGQWTGFWRQAFAEARRVS